MAGYEEYVWQLRKTEPGVDFDKMHGRIHSKLAENRRNSIRSRLTAGGALILMLAVFSLYLYAFPGLPGNGDSVSDYIFEQDVINGNAVMSYVFSVE